MFNRRPMYVMEINALINYPLEALRANHEELAALSDADVRSAGSGTVISVVSLAALDELKRNGQKLKRRFKAGGYRWDTGSNITVNQLGEHYIDFTFAFEGNRDGAIAAAEAWIEYVEACGFIDRITRAALRGTDGTNLQRFDEEILEQAANLDDETKARIDELMDPNRRDDV